MDMGAEVMVWMGIGVIFLSLITVFVHEWDFTEDAETLEKIYEEEGEIKFDDKLEKIEFITVAKNFWDYCNHSYVNKSKIVYVFNDEKENNGTLTKIDVFDQIKSLNWCGSLQSKNLSCGRREDVNMTNIILPKIVRIECKNNTLFIK